MYVHICSYLLSVRPYVRKITNDRQIMFDCDKVILFPPLLLIVKNTLSLKTRHLYKTYGILGINIQMCPSALVP